MTDILTQPGIDQAGGLPGGALLADDVILINRNGTFYRATVGDLSDLLVPSGVAIVATGDQTVDVEMEGITTSSRILITLATDDATATTAIVLPDDGLFTIKLNDVCTGDCNVIYTIVKF